MSAADVRARIEPGLGRARAAVEAQLERSTELLPDLSKADKRVRVAAAFATGLVLGRVVKRVGR